MIVEVAMGCVTAIIVSSLWVANAIDARRTRPEKDPLEEELAVQMRIMETAFDDEDRERAATRVRELQKEMKGASS